MCSCQVLYLEMTSIHKVIIIFKTEMCIEKYEIVWNQSTVLNLHWGNKKTWMDFACMKILVRTHQIYDIKKVQIALGIYSATGP